MFFECFAFDGNSMPRLLRAFTSIRSSFCWKKKGSQVFSFDDNERALVRLKIDIDRESDGEIETR